jgi:hypothetical protein
VFRRMEGRTEISLPGDNFTPREQSSLLGDNFFPGGSKFAPRGEVKNEPKSAEVVKDLAFAADCSTL